MTDKVKRNVALDIRNDPGVKRLLLEMPESVQASFSDEQLMHLRHAFGDRHWGSHSVDCRGVFSLPFCRWRFYFVLLFGRNRRQLSCYEKRLSLWVGSLVTLGILLGGCLVMVLGIYLLKSALGIDFFKAYSFGIWHWFNTNLF